MTKAKEKTQLPARVGELSARAEKSLPVSARAEKTVLSKTLRAYIERNGLRPKFDLADPVHRREQARMARDAGTVSQVMLGYWLAEIQSAEGQEAFQQAYAELNIGKTSAYQAVAQFHIFNRFDDLEVVQALGTLQPSTFRALSLSDSEWVEFARGQSVHGYTLDEARDFTFVDMQKRERDWREMDEQMKRKNAQIATLETKLEAREATLEKMKHHLAHRHDNLPMPEFAAVTREESAALTEKMLACLTSLQDLAKINLLVERDEPEAEKFQSKAAATLYFTLLPIVAQGETLLLELQAAYPQIEAGVTFESQLTKPEAKHYLKARAAILEEHAKEAKNREALRENAKPGKKGRKRAVAE